MSSGDGPSKSRRVDSVTIPSVCEEEASLSTLGRPDLRSSSGSASRERAADWGNAAWGPIAASADDSRADENAAPPSEGTLPSVCPRVTFARGTLVAQRY